MKELILDHIELICRLRRHGCLDARDYLELHDHATLILQVYKNLNLDAAMQLYDAVKGVIDR